MFQDLFVFEMANNHQGDIAHGIQIVNNCTALKDEFNLNAGVKLQFRNLETFVHPDHLPGGPKEDTNRHVKRFTSTKLSDAEWLTMFNTIKENGLKAICTPFDEPSVDKIVEMGFDIIKVGSPSLYDFPLLERVATCGLPVIISSGGCALEHVDKLVSFFTHRQCDFALMHCVSIYPTPDDKLELNTIRIFKKRYPGLTIGFSTHEPPENVQAIQMAYAIGAKMFEKHVGHANETYSLNKYSTNYAQTREWIQSYKRAQDMVGGSTPRIPTEKEQADLQRLARGVFAKHDIEPGVPIQRSDVYFAFPITPGGITTSEFVEGKTFDTALQENDALMTGETIEPTDSEIIYHFVHKVKGLLNNAKVFLPHNCNMEVSHHIGTHHLNDVGAFLVTCLSNEEYAKKIVVMTEKQRHPQHYHAKKDESFHLLYGDLTITLNGVKRTLYIGEVVRVPRMCTHAFETNNGCVFEEISSTAYGNDSFYKNPTIQNNVNRKTKLLNWQIRD